MGNKSSSNKRGDVTGIIRQGRPGDGGAQRPRPTSEPIVGAPPFTMDPNGAVSPYGNSHDRNFSLRAREQADISGRQAGYDPRMHYASNPVLSAGDGYDEVDQLSALPRGFPETTSPEELDLYRRSLDQVTAIWPEYSALRDISYQELRRPIRNILQQILKRIAEQHDFIKQLSEDQHESRQHLEELREERDAMRQLVKRRDQENRGLKEDVLLLRQELSKRGHDIRLPLTRGNPLHDNQGSDFSNPGTPQHGTPEARHRGFSDSDMTSSGAVEDEALDRLRRRERGGIFKATPLIQAEGAARDGVKRTQSLKPILQGSGPYYKNDRSLTRDSSFRTRESEEVQEVKDILRRTEAALDRERRDNEILKERLKVSDPSKMFISNLRPKKSLSHQEYADRYHSLETLALNKVAKALTHHLSHADIRRRQMFSCAVIQKSYDASFNTVRQFKDTIKALIMNPVNVHVAAASGDLNRQGSIIKQIKLLEHFQPGQGANPRMSKLAKKTQASEEIPEALTNQIYDFLESMADVTNIMDLVENVVDDLRREYGDCTTSALLNHADFAQYIHDSCRLCWQMCVIDNPLYVSSKDHWHFDERYHEAQSGSGNTNAKIDLYVFPVLFSKRTQGEVVHKGRVVIKL